MLQEEEGDTVREVATPILRFYIERERERERVAALAAGWWPLQ